MSEDKTQDISAKYDTKPTIETILEEMRDFRASVEKKFDQVDKRFDQLDVRLHRIESDGHDTHNQSFTRCAPTSTNCATR